LEFLRENGMMETEGDRRFCSEAGKKKTVPGGNGFHERALRAKGLAR